MNRKLIVFIIGIGLLTISNTPFFLTSTSIGVNTCKIGDNVGDFEKPLVITFVDENLTHYEKLTSKINRYSNDIKNTLNVRTLEVNVNSSWTVNNIQLLLQEKYDNDGLIGIVLIGNICTPFYDNFPSLYPYSDLNKKYGADIWIGVIRPPIEGSESIVLLNDYFDRNHDYHTGKLVFNKECLLASAYENNEVLADRVQRSGRWLPNRIVGNESEDKTWKTHYLENITKSAELIHFHGHGSPKQHQHDIWYSDIQENPPNAAFIYLQSCTTGKFTEENYIGGWYLFSGHALTVMTYTSPVWGFPGSGWGDGDKTIHLLSYAGGSCIGNAVLSSHPLQQTMVLLGDPTIKLSHVAPKDDQIFSSDVGPIAIGRENESVEESWYRDHILSADFNGDYKIDIVTENTLYLNKGIGRYALFDKKETILTGERPDAVDFDNDGDIDIISAGENIKIFLNDGYGNFKINKTIDGRTTKAVAANDFDNDGDIDILASNETGTVVYYRQTDGLFSENKTYAVFWQPYGMVSFDFDNDYDYDCIIGDKAGYLNFFENTGNGDFTLVKKQIGGYDYHGLTSGDFDDDGDIDLFIKGTNCNYRLLFNDGNGDFNPTDSILAFSDMFLSFGVAADDFDNDGEDDILLTHYDGIHFKKNYNGFHNDPPYVLSFNGPSKGKAGKEYSYIISGVDPDNNQVFYYIDWGDGQSNWSGPHESQQQITFCHTWEKKGSYMIKAKAFDEYFYESDWETLNLDMPRNKVSSNIFLKLLNNHFKLLKLLQYLIL